MILVLNLLVIAISASSTLKSIDGANEWRNWASSSSSYYGPPPASPARFGGGHRRRGPPDPATPTRPRHNRAPSRGTLEAIMQRLSVKKSTLKETSVGLVRVGESGTECLGVMVSVNGNVETSDIFLTVPQCAEGGVPAVYFPGEKKKNPAKNWANIKDQYSIPILTLLQLTTKRKAVPLQASSRSIADIFVVNMNRNDGKLTSERRDVKVERVIPDPDDHQPPLGMLVETRNDDFAEYVTIENQLGYDPEYDQDEMEDNEGVVMPTMMIQGAPLCDRISGGDADKDQKIELVALYQPSSRAYISLQQYAGKIEEIAARRFGRRV